MNADQLRIYLQSMPEAVEDYPFGPDAQVFKVLDKVFAIVGQMNGVDQVNLKCDPEEACALRDIFDAVIPGYHMNKKHWNTIILNGTIPEAEITRMVDNSYLLVLKGLSKKQRQGLELRNKDRAPFKHK